MSEKCASQTERTDTCACVRVRVCVCVCVRVCVCVCVCVCVICVPGVSKQLTEKTRTPSKGHRQNYTSTPMQRTIFMRVNSRVYYVPAATK